MTKEFSPDKVIFTVRSMNDELFNVARGFLPSNYRVERLLSTSADGYFDSILEYPYDWVVNVDEDCFVFDPEAPFRIMRHMKENGYSFCGMPDGGCVSIRCSDPIVPNAFFNVFNMKEIRKTWKWGTRLEKVSHERKNELLELRKSQGVPVGKLDRWIWEPYYNVFYHLLANSKPLYLNAEKLNTGKWEHNDPTVLKDVEGAPFCYHTWYTRNFRKDRTHTERIIDIMNRAKTEYDTWKTKRKTSPP